jgi:hypothetical protein
LKPFSQRPLRTCRARQRHDVERLAKDKGDVVCLVAHWSVGSEAPTRLTTSTFAAVPKLGRATFLARSTCHRNHLGVQYVGSYSGYTA